MPTQHFLSNGSGGVGGIGGVRLEHDSAGDQGTPTPFVLEAGLVLLAMGSTGPERTPLLTDLDLRLDDRGTVLAGRYLDDEPARRLHGRGHAARPVAHRLGHGRWAPCCPCRGPTVDDTIRS